MNAHAWYLIAAAVSAGCLAWLVHYMRRHPQPRILAFAVYVVFFRFLLSAFHPFTFPPLAGPFSINALYSVAVIAIGFLLIDHRLLGLRFLMPVYGLLLLILISAFYNNCLRDSVESLVKWLFFIVIVLAIYESVIRAGRAQVLQSLLLAFNIPILLQLVSVALGYNKVSDSDNSVSYVGGYNHESVFSVMLFTGFVLAALRSFCQPAPPRGWNLLPLLLMAELALANYRTSILGLLLPAGGYLYLRFLRRGPPLAKVGSVLTLTAGCLLVAATNLHQILDRFTDIGTVLDSVHQLIKPPAFYTEWEQDYFSARVYIWSQYITAYLQGNSVQHLIGLGADSWQHLFRKYAHNSFISSLYELGVTGFLLLAWFFLRNLIRNISRPLTAYRALLLLSFFGFLVINLGTMPLWQIEGMVLFAVLNALTWESKLTRPATAVATHPPEQDVPLLRQTVQYGET